MPNNQDFNVDRNTVKSPGDSIGTAIILAAGMGVRLKERGKLMPKGCLCLGEKPIFEESVLRLLAVGIERIVIVTGHLAEQYDPYGTCTPRRFNWSTTRTLRIRAACTRCTVPVTA